LGGLRHWTQMAHWSFWIRRARDIEFLPVMYFLRDLEG